MIILGGSASSDLAEKVANEVGENVARLETKRFTDGELPLSSTWRRSEDLQDSCPEPFSHASLGKICSENHTSEEAIRHRPRRGGRAMGCYRRQGAGCRTYSLPKETGT